MVYGDDDLDEFTNVLPLLWLEDGSLNFTFSILFSRWLYLMIFMIFFEGTPPPNFSTKVHTRCYGDKILTN